MRKLIIAGIAMMTIAIFSCSEETTTLGNSLTSDVDKFVITSDTFDISTRSIIADSVLSRSQYSYLGRMKDPETGSYVTASYTTQFNILEEEVYFIPIEDLVSKDNDDVIIEFPESNELLYYKTTHLIDSKFNEFSNYNNNYERKVLATRIGDDAARAAS